MESDTLQKSDNFTLNHEQKSHQDIKLRTEHELAEAYEEEKIFAEIGTEGELGIEFIDASTTSLAKSVEGKKADNNTSVKTPNDRENSAHVPHANDGETMPTRIESAGNKHTDASRIALDGESSRNGRNAPAREASPMFKPLLNSVLHNPANASPARARYQEPLFCPSPSPDGSEINVDVISLHSTDLNVDVISLHSTNSDGVSDNDDVVAMEDVKGPRDSLFTPPTSSDDEDDIPLSQFIQAKKHTRYVMSHVEIPPLPYKRARRPKLPRQVHAHSSLVAALQSQMEHNNDIHDEDDMIIDKRPKKKKATPQQNAVAGPSKPRVKPSKKHRRVVYSSSEDEHAGKPAKSDRKRQRVTIDLTADDDEPMNSLTQPNSRPSQPQDSRPAAPCAARVRSPNRHSSKTPSSSMPQATSPYRLSLDSYAPVPESTAFVNMRFLVPWSADTSSGHRDNPGIAPRGAYPTTSRFLSKQISEPPKSLTSNDEDMSLGHSYLDKDTDFEDESTFSDVEWQMSTQADARPLKIDLVAEFRKRKKAEKAKQKQKLKQKQHDKPSSSDFGPQNAFAQEQFHGDTNPPFPGLDVQESNSMPPTGPFSTSSSSDPLELMYPSSDDVPASPSKPMPQQQQQQSSSAIQSSLGGSIPSSTALGKRIRRLPSPVQHFPFAVQNPRGNLDVFMHNYGPGPSSPDLLPPEPRDPGDATNNPFAGAVDPFTELYALQERDDARMDADTMANFRQSDENTLPASAGGAGPQHLEGAASFRSGDLFEGLGRNSWMTAADQQYEYTTVDPTLICGGSRNGEDEAEGQWAGSGTEERSTGGGVGGGANAHGGIVGNGDEDGEDEAEAEGTQGDYEEVQWTKEESLFSGHSPAAPDKAHSPVAGSTSSSYSRSSSAMPLPTSLTSLDGSPGSSTSDISLSKSSRPQVAPRPSARSSSVLSSHTETASTAVNDVARVFVARYDSSPLSDMSSLPDDSLTEDDMDSTSQSVDPHRTKKGKVVVVKRQVLLGPFADEPAPEWDEETPDHEVYCHQCRRKTARRITRCLCNAKYCETCVKTRYSRTKFTFSERVKVCPKCERWCNCTQCVKARGEPYISARLGRVTLGAKTNIPPPPHSSLPTRPVKALPSRLATELVSSSCNTRPPASQSSSQLPIPAAKKKDRVFIGAVQPSWGLGKRPRARELDPAPRAVWPENPTGKCAVRYYVGSSDFLRYKPTGLECTDDLLAGVTSLASLDESDDDEGGSSSGEDTSATNDHNFNLSQADIARAITASNDPFRHPAILDENSV